MRGATGVLAWLAPRAVPRIEAVLQQQGGLGAYRRSLRGADGPRVVSAAVVDDAASTADADLARLFDVDGAAARAAADARLTWAAERHGAPALALAVAASPALAQPGCADAHEMLVRAIVGQQITVAAATLQLGLLSAAGDALPEALAGDGIDRLFPTMAQVASGADLLRGPAAKTDAVRRAAEAVASGSIEVAPGADLERMRTALQALKGIGPWTVGYLSLRLGDPDVLLLGDVAVRKGARHLGIADLPALAADCAGHRSALMLRCWAASAKPSTTA